MSKLCRCIFADSFVIWRRYHIGGEIWFSVIEDASYALGATYKDIQVGFADIRI